MVGADRDGALRRAAAVQRAEARACRILAGRIASAPALSGFGRDDKAGVLAAETERIGQRHVHLPLSRPALAAAGLLVFVDCMKELPATLLLVPLVADRPGVVLAVLLGVNIGPNLAYFGSLANLLWRSVVRRDIKAGFGEFSLIGLVTTPAVLVGAVLALWACIQMFGL